MCWYLASNTAPVVSQDPPAQTDGVKAACLCWSTVKILCQGKQPGQDRWAGISSVPLTTGCLYPRQTKRQLWCDTCSPAGLADFTVDLLSPVLFVQKAYQDPSYCYDFPDNDDQSCRMLLLLLLLRIVGLYVWKRQVIPWELWCLHAACQWLFWKS